LEGGNDKESYLWPTARSPGSCSPKFPAGSAPSSAHRRGSLEH
jgi:hypothetical protein